MCDKLKWKPVSWEEKTQQCRDQLQLTKRYPLISILINCEIHHARQFSLKGHLLEAHCVSFDSFITCSRRRNQLLCMQVTCTKH